MMLVLNCAEFLKERLNYYEGLEQMYEESKDFYSAEKVRKKREVIAEMLVEVIENG